VDQRRIFELEECRRRAEEDKRAAVRALEVRSREFMQEKQQKRALEKRIMKLTSQMISTPFLENSAHSNVMEAGAAPAGGPLSSQHTTAEYNSRLAELERERECIEHEKAQVERYKQLLLKQRDIMIALTQRLNERDEQIMALQDELDAYDKNQAALENKLDIKTEQCIRLQRSCSETLNLDGQAREEDYPPLNQEAYLQRCGVDGVLPPNRQRVSELTALLALRDKERCAVQTIFEKKIAILVDDIASGLTQPNHSPTIARITVLRDLNALRRLVRASVDALKQAGRANMRCGLPV